MSLVLADRVRETTQTTGTGTIILDGAVQGFQSFSVIGNNNTTYYTINRGAEWEVGIGTYYGGTLSRDTVYASSNGGSKVNFSAGAKDVFVTYPAEKSVNQDENNRVLIPYTSGTTNVGSLNVGNATSHTDSGVIAGFTASEPLYLYTSLQNTSASNTSYASYAVNDGGHTAYGELGINNANYSYSAAGFPNNGFSTPLASFVESFGGPLVLGSWDSQKISFIVNGAVNTADAMTIETTGAVTIPTAAVTGGTINGATVGATTAAAGTFTTLNVTGTTNQISSVIVSSIPSAPSAGNVKTFAFSDAGYEQPAFLNSTNNPTVFQPSFGSKRICWASIRAQSVTLDANGLTGTAIGTLTAVAAATTFIGRIGKGSYVSLGVAGSTAGQSSIQAFYLGVAGTPNASGFYGVWKFGIGDSVSNTITFVGMNTTSGGPASATASPATYVNAIGVGQASGDANLSIYYGGSSSQTPIALGSNFPASTAGYYTLELFSPPNSATSVYYKVTRLDTGVTASGTLTGTAGTALPANTTALRPCFFRSNNATASAVTMLVSQVYIETDY